MALLKPEYGCLTCTRQSGAHCLSAQNDENRTITNVLRKHFWFTEVDFQRTCICQTCWDLVNHFHQFYESVQELYHNRLASVIVKSEPAAQEAEPSQPPDRSILVKEEPPETTVAETLVKEEPPEEIANESDYLPSSDEEDDDDLDNADGDDHAPKKPKREYKSMEQRHLDDAFIRKHVKYSCEQCGQESESFTSFLQHALEVHANKTPHITCCGRKYYHRSYLYDHVQVVNNPEIFRCELCRRNFQYKWGFHRHMREIHSTEQERMFKCNRCPRTYAFKSLYNKHIKRHLAQESGVAKLRHACTECSNTFSNGRILRDHVAAIHTGVSRYKCPFCEKSFNSNANLYRHKKRIHPSELQELQNNRNGDE